MPPVARIPHLMANGFDAIVRRITLRKGRLLQQWPRLLIRILRPRIGEIFLRYINGMSCEGHLQPVYSGVKAGKRDVTLTQGGGDLSRRRARRQTGASKQLAPIQDITVITLLIVDRDLLTAAQSCSQGGAIRPAGRYLVYLVAGWRLQTCRHR